MKLEYIVVYENSSDKFDIELCRINFKVTVGILIFPHLPQYKLSGPIVQLFLQARNLILSIYVHLILIYKINECHHA